jgi:hypothetical protein
MAGSLVVRHDGTWFHAVFGAAVGALGEPVMAEIEKYARMGRPQRHCRVRAMGWQVFAVEFDRGHFVLVHDFSVGRAIVAKAKPRF